MSFFGVFARLGLVLVLSASTVQVRAGSVKHGTDRYEFRYQLKLPLEVEEGRLWVPLARSDAFQAVNVMSISGPPGRREVRDRDHGNKVLVWDLSETDAGKEIEILYQVERREKPNYVVTEPDLTRYLRAERLVPINETFKTIALEAVKGQEGEMQRARALYDHVLKRIRYDKSGTGWGRGDAVYACDVRTGNCTDFHAYFIALSRSLGIPSRFAIGYTIPTDAAEGAIGGYHCWAEILAEGQWVPVDISEASKAPEFADYYFGHHPANRLEVTSGRDLIVEPAPVSGAMNFLIYPLLEVGGEVVKTENDFSFRRL